MSRSKYDKMLQEWASKWKQENLSEQVRKLISQANFDLYYGPVQDGAVGDPAEGDEEWNSYPGFTTATKTISQELQALPSDLYIDDMCGDVSEHEPQAEKCESCNGEGVCDNEEDNLTPGTCNNCHGHGYFDPEEYWHIERADIRQAIVGKELSEYLR